MVSLPDKVTGKYLTLAVNANCSIDDAYTDTPNDETQSEFPQGTMYFELACAETETKIYFHALSAAETPSLQKYGPLVPGDLSTLSWFEIPNVTYGTEVIDGQSVVTATYSLKDGELGDSTGVDGRIIDPVGLTLDDEEVDNVVSNVISFVSDSTTISTQLGSVGIPISRLGSEGTLSVNYTTVNGSAIADQDYQAISGTLTWDDGDKDSQIVTINLLDSAVAGNTLSLALSNLIPSGDAVLALDTLSITITDEVPVEEIPEEIPTETEEVPVAEIPIEGTSNSSTANNASSDNDEELVGNATANNNQTDQPKGDNIISFTSKGYISYKDDGIATITINRNGTQGIVSIDYTTIDGTASAGQDYQTTSGTLTWDIDEEGEQSFEVELLDTATLGNSLILSLGNLSNAEGQFGTDIAVLTILDEVDPSTRPTTADGQTTASTSGEDTATPPTTDEAETTAESTADTTATGTLNEPTIVVTVSPDVIVDGGDIDDIFHANEQIFYEDITVADRGSVSHAIFDAGVENNGLIANSTFTENASLNGGTLSGNIKNAGLIQDVNFVGMLLTGGTLSGNVTNNSQIGGVIQEVELAPGATLTGGKIGGEINAAPDSTLKDVELTAGTQLSGGILVGEITGDPNNPPIITAAEIAPGAVLSNVRISPSVVLPDDVVLGPGVILPSEPPTLEDFGFEAADIAALDAESLAELEPAVFGTLGPEDMESIPPEAMSKMAPEQMAELPKETLGGLSAEQFGQLPAQALSGLKSDNMGGFSTGVLDKFTPEHLSALNADEFTQMPSEDVSKLFLNFNADNISVENVAKLIPSGWEIDPNSGEITAPAGAKLTPRTLPASDNIPAAVKLPQVADIGQGMGLGGQGTSVKDNMKRSLADQDLSNFVLSQKETGILWVEGTGESEGIKFTFIPDADNVIQVDGDKVPIGLSIEEGGFYTITTPDQKQYQVVPAPQDPVALSEVLDGGEVVIGKRGDVMMEIPDSDTRKRGKPRQVAMFEPFIEPAPDDLCVEIAPGEIVCDFDNAPPSQQPGIHLEANTRAAYKNQQQAKVIYPDGTAQLITPTLFSPDVFAELGFEFDGVEDVVFNANGIFYVQYQGQPYLIIPKFEVVTEEVTEEEIAAENDEQPSDSSIVINNDGTLTYTIVIDEKESNTRKRGKPRQVMQFKPEIQVAPDDLCVEIAPGDIVCDFE